MDTSNDTRVQAAELDQDVIAALERYVRRLGVVGDVMVETHFGDDGAYRRGYVRLGPLKADAFRELGRPA